MNKKVMAVAVAGALAAPGVALAQTSTVQIGGAIHLIYAHHDGGNNNSKDGDILTTSEPEIYIRGEEKVGGGNSFWFMCTSSFDVIGTTGQSASAGWCGRNSAIGYKGSWGNLFAGTWDTPSKMVYSRVRGWFGATNPFAGTGVLLLNGSGSNIGNAGANFHNRMARSINYHSPSWNGFTLNAQFTAGNHVTGLTNVTLQQQKPRSYSVAANYTSGPLWVGAGYERHIDWNPGGVAIGNTASTYGGGDDDQWTIGASYTFAGVFKLSGAYVNTDYNVTNTGDLKTDGWAVFADWAIQGPHSLKAQYGKVDDPTGTNTGNTVGGYTTDLTRGAGFGGGGHVWGVAYAYNFSKRTQGYLEYNKMSSDGGARYGLGVATTSNGNAQKMYGAGLRHRF